MKTGEWLLNQNLTYKKNNIKKKTCQICPLQMPFLLEANTSCWLNGARSHQCSDLSTEMRHKAKENISILSISPPTSKDSAILLLSQQTAASWDPNR